MRIIHDIYVGKQHLESTISPDIPGSVALDFGRSPAVEIDPGESAKVRHGQQTDGGRILPLAVFQCSDQDPGNERSYADAAGTGSAGHPLGNSFFKRDCGPRDEWKNLSTKSIYIV